LAEVAAWENLCYAFWRAAKGHRDRNEVQRFEKNLENELQQLGAKIRNQTVPLGHFSKFKIRDPKERTIHAPCFRERIVHHALMNVVGPVLDKALIEDTFACRKGKGVLAAVERVQKHMQRYPWYVKIDIRKYFDSIDHQKLKSLLRNRLKKQDLLGFCNQIVDSYSVGLGKGLPIGALTSQHFANWYLSGLDRFLLEKQKVMAMARYMDDVLWWCGNKTEAKRTLAEVKLFLKQELKLEIKGEGRIQRSEKGVTFCGFRILPAILRLSARRKRRYAQARKRWEMAYRFGRIDGKTLQQGYASALAITANADAASFRREQLKRVSTIDV
jgi:retron-type reverse transcriptase